MGYDEYLPPSYSPSGSRSPLLIALNGYGENGDGTADGLRNLLQAGIPRFIDVGGWPTNRPLVVLALQHVEDPPFDFSPCDGVQWGASCNMQLQHDRNHLPSGFCTTPDEVRDFIAYAVSHYNVDPHRVYVTGLSCGAFGAWEYLKKYGTAAVAAAILIAGDGRPAWAPRYCGLASVPLWAFHGELDDVVNPLGSIAPLTALRACRGVAANRAQLTVYPGLFHDGWDQAYSGSLGDDIYTWMLGFSK
jgi:predicted peptidase